METNPCQPGFLRLVISLIVQHLCLWFFFCHVEQICLRNCLIYQSCWPVLTVREIFEIYDSMVYNVHVSNYWICLRVDLLKFISKGKLDWLVCYQLVTVDMLVILSGCRNKKTLSIEIINKVKYTSGMTWYLVRRGFLLFNFERLKNAPYCGACNF